MHFFPLLQSLATNSYLRLSLSHSLTYSYTHAWLIACDTEMSMQKRVFADE